MKKERLAMFVIQVVLQILLFISRDEGITLPQKSKITRIKSFHVHISNLIFSCLVLYSNSCTSELVGGCVCLNLFTCILQYSYGTLRYLGT